MKLLIASACAVMAQLQERVAHTRLAAFHARQRLAKARAAEANGRGGSGDIAVLQATAAGLDAAVPAVLDDLRQADSDFAFVLRQFPAANDEHFNEPDRRA